MKRNVYIIGELLIMCMLLIISACTDVMVSPPDGEDVKEVPIALEIDNLFSSNQRTYGTDYPGYFATGNDAENLVDNIVVYVFDYLYQCEKILEFSSASYTNSFVIGPVMVKSGIKHFIAIANGDGKLALEKITPSNVIYSDLLKEITYSFPAFPESPFLMTGIINGINIPPDLTISSPHPVGIKITRAVAKITMQVTKSGNAANPNINIRRVTFFHGADRVALFNAPSPNPTDYNLDTTLIYSPTISVPTSTTIPPTNYVALEDTIYTYESLCGADTTKAVRIEIESEVNSPTNIKTAKFYLATYEYNPGDSIYNIYRNYWYNVKVNIIDPGMDSVYVDIIACPWNVADPIDTIEGVGGEFTTALPFKLVKNLMYNEMIWTYGGGTTSWGAIDSHSKGASWIDFKVTDGANWVFDVKDNTARNQNVYYSLDKTTWALLPASGTGDDVQHRIYIYRPYLENNEPQLGPSLYVSLNNIYQRDFIIQPRDTLPIPTNSYVLRPQLSGVPINETRAYIPLAGVFSHWENEIAVANTFRSYLPITAEVLWKDHPTQEVVRNNVSVIHAYNPDSAYIYAEAGEPGNAVIVMRLTVPPSTPDIYWTFHVWVTEYNPYEAAGQNLYPSTGAVRNVFMDRNLGAMSNTWDAEGNARGLFYQFGRKDPFPRGENWDNAPPWKWFDPSNTRIPTLSPITAASIMPLPPYDFRPKNVLQTPLNNPMSFITRTSGDPWPLSLDSLYLWNSRMGNKTAYDPCPEGWRVPDVIEPWVSGNFPWDGVLLNPGVTNGFNNSVTNGWYSPLVGYYPKSGYINESGALVSTAGIYTCVWTSNSINLTTDMAMGLFDNTGFPVRSSAIDRAWGASVRCVVDKNYIRNAVNGGLFGTGITNLKNVLLP